jgi:hypothetical protein
MDDATPDPVIRSKRAEAYRQALVQLANDLAIGNPPAYYWVRAQIAKILVGTYELRNTGISAPTIDDLKCVYGHHQRRIGCVSCVLVFDRPAERNHIVADAKAAAKALESATSVNAGATPSDQGAPESAQNISSSSFTGLITRLEDYAYKATMLGSLSTGADRNALLKFGAGFKEALSALTALSQALTEKDQMIAIWKSNSRDHRLEATLFRERAEHAEASLAALQQEWHRQVAHVTEQSAHLHRLIEALRSIANNSCCGPCLEARNVARAALAALHVPRD